MNPYQDYDFLGARQRAYDHLSRTFTVCKRETQGGELQGKEVWEVEIEINTSEKVVILPISIVLTSDFPLHLPFIYLDKEEVRKLGFPPNINTEGEICTFDRFSSIPNLEAPEILMEDCVRRAKSHIEQGLNSDQHDQYSDEFIAYWEGKYGDEVDVDCCILSLIDEKGGVPNQVAYVLLEKPIGKYNSIIYSDPLSFIPLKTFLKTNNIDYTESTTFYLGQIRDLSPPFHKTNGDVQEMLIERGQLPEFQEYLKSSPILPIVTFSVVLEERVLMFGWCHDPIELVIEGRRKGKTKKLLRSRYNKLLSRKNSTIPVKRFSPQVLTKGRLFRRSAADYKGLQTTEGLKVLVAGLGSIGSQLIPYLQSIGTSEFRLVDFDRLSIENIGRHLLGITDVGRNKADAVRNYIQWKNPLSEVQIRQKSIVSLIIGESEFFRQCDYYFFCTGDTNSEAWVANNLLQSEWCRPTFFIWVEPYLAGGHCLYLNGVDNFIWERLFVDNMFIHNIISNEIHRSKDFTWREAGCQTSYLPYSQSSLILFISTLFPKLLEVIIHNGDSRCFTWVGDLDFLKGKDIPINTNIEGAKSFTFIERPVC